MADPETTVTPPTSRGAWLLDHVKRIGRSGVVGAACVTIDLSMLYVGAKLLGLPPWLAKALSFGTASVVQFLGSREFTFRASEGRMSRQAIYYLIVEVLAFGLNIVSFFFLQRSLPKSWPMWLPAMLAGAISFWLFTYPIWHWVFKLTPEEAARQEQRKLEAAKAKLEASAAVSEGARSPR